MRGKKTLREELEAVYEPTPEMFHRRVQDTLGSIRTQSMKEECVVRKKIGWAAVLLAALLLMASMGVAAKWGGVFDFITYTEAKNEVLEEAKGMLHEDVSQVRRGDCVVSLREWVCDGEKLYVLVSIVDPVLETEGHYVPEDEEEDYLGGLNAYGLRYGPQEVKLSEGEAVDGLTWDFMWGDEEKNEILYTFETTIQNVPDEFTVSILLTCSAGECELAFDVVRADFGRVRDYEASQVTQAEGYSAQMTRLRATALRTYAELTLTFESSMPQEERSRIASDYMDGLGVPEGRLDVVAGEGEEIVIARQANWSQDGLVCTIKMEGNPRETFPERFVYCPRWGASDFDWEDEMPPLSMEGAVVIELKERE